MRLIPAAPDRKHAPPVTAGAVFYRPQWMKGGRPRPGYAIGEQQRLSVQGLPRGGIRVMWLSCILLRNGPLAVAR